jgi:hypothetical protein
MTDTPMTPLQARQAEVAQYEANIAMYTAIIATLLPGNGIRFSNGCYITLPASAAITIFWG